MTKIDGVGLWHGLKNASLFCREKTWNGGECRIRVRNGWMEVTASDDFVAICTHLPFPSSNKEWQRFVSARQLRGGRSEPGLEKTVSDHVGDYTQSELKELLDGCCYEPQEPAWWEELDSIFENAEKANLATIEVNPARVSLLSRLEPKGSYPLSIRGGSYKDESLWVFAYGPDTMGVIVPLDRQELDQHKDWLL